MTTSRPKATARMLLLSISSLCFACYGDADIYGHRYNAAAGCIYDERVKIGEDKGLWGACPTIVVCRMSLDRTLTFNTPQCADHRYTEHAFRPCTDEELSGVNILCEDGQTRSPANN